MRVSYTLAGLAVLVNSDCRLAVTDERAVAENYNFITRFSACACLVAVCLCCSFCRSLSTWSALFVSHPRSWYPLHDPVQGMPLMESLTARELSLGDCQKLT